MGARKTVGAYDLASPVLNEAIEKININGSGISLGHRIACTGSRVLVALLHEMKRRDARPGLECICGSGGPGKKLIGFSGKIRGTRCAGVC